MGSSVITWVALGIGGAALASSVYFYRQLGEKVEDISQEVNDLERDIKSLQIESEAFGEEEITEEMDKDELFEKNVRKLAERLFALLKTKHGVDDVTTYKEMQDVLQDMDSEDQELKEELMDFYETAIRLEYSNEELSEAEREKMKQTAVDLIKKTGQDLK